MFTNFDKVFFKKKEVGNQIPSEVIEVLNDDLPDGLVYQEVENGTLVAISKEDLEMTISGFSIEMPDDFPIPLEEKPTLGDLLDFMYRTQRDVELKLSNNKISVNGALIDIDKLISFPILKNNVRDFKLLIRPQAFPNPTKLSIRGNGIEKEVLFKRKPYADMKKILVESIGKEAFETSYILDEKTHQLTFNFKIVSENATNIEQIIEALKLYQAFLTGNIEFAGQMLPNNQDNELERESIAESILFWTKILELERRLNVSFNPKSSITREDLILLEQLYRSFIENKPFRERSDISSFSMDLFPGGDIEQLLGTEDMTFQYIQNSVVRLLDVEIYVSSIVGLFDFKVTGIKYVNSEKSKCKMFIEPLQGKEMYSSTLLFENEEEAKSFKDLSMLREAERIILK